MYILILVYFSLNLLISGNFSAVLLRELEYDDRENIYKYIGLFLLSLLFGLLIVIGGSLWYFLKPKIQNIFKKTTHDKSN